MVPHTHPARSRMVSGQRGAAPAVGGEYRRRGCRLLDSERGLTWDDGQPEEERGKDGSDLRDMPTQPLSAVTRRIARKTSEKKSLPANTQLNRGWAARSGRRERRAL